MEEELETASGSDERSLPEKRKQKNAKFVLKIKNLKSYQRHGCDDDVGFARKDLDCRVRAGGSDRVDNFQLKNDRDNDFADDADNVADEKLDERENDQLMSSTEKKFICSVCEKKFMSMKSLSGHMRCHPDRPWRGIHPPLIFKNSSSPAGSDSAGRNLDDQVDSDTMTESSASDHLRSLSSWPVTARRPRKVTVPVAAAENPNLNEELQESIADAVYNLLMLSKGDPLELSSVKKKKRKVGDEEFRAENREFLLKKTEIDVLRDGCDPKLMNLDSKLENSDGFCDEDQNSEESESKNMNYNRPMKKLNYGSNVIKKKIMKKQRKIRALKTVPDELLTESKKKLAAARRYYCSTCNKSFSTHQALGGHRASHKKGKNDVGGDLEYDGNTIIAADYSGGSPRSHDQLPKPAASLHQCKICDKSFPSGQALGGHQRCHWSGHPEPPASSITSQDDETKAGRRSAALQDDGTKSGHRILEFDLNELPPMITDDDDQTMGLDQEYVSH
ncbi:zinc finger protein ZAT4-like [Magnolia sinica]|uniref:zinc finger protein ZAT4-like n=1 Tax=Magnolia sinica TaxID=86752 RepID=UPI00265A28A2|nr:zinc finger protein ZAT4-like [Magnolia sinica]